MDDGSRILLTGMMGSGKTTVGHALARLTGWDYLDNDELVQENTGQPTPEFLAGADEPALRRVERAALDAALSAPPPVIAAAAAGAVLDVDARRLMSERAFVVYLHAPVDVLADRVGGGAGRPWIHDDARPVLARLYQGRDELYREAADLVLDVEDASPEELAARIVDAVRP
jgi:shikimate kinase